MEGESLYRSGPHALMMAPVTAAPAISLPPQTDFVNTSAEVKDLEYHGWLTRAGIQCRAPRMDEWQKSMRQHLKNVDTSGQLLQPVKEAWFFKMSAGLFRFLTKGLLVRQANVWTAVLICCQAVPQQELSTCSMATVNLMGWKRLLRRAVAPVCISCVALLIFRGVLTQKHPNM